MNDDQIPLILIQHFVPKHSVNDEVHKTIKSNKYHYLFQVPDDSTYTASTTWFDLYCFNV